MRRSVILALLGLLAMPALAQPSTPPAAPATVRVSLETSEGPILLELEAGRAPITTANFLRYVDKKRLDGAVFYRALRTGPATGLIQGGLRNDPTKIFPPIAHEPTTQTGLKHIDGTISMARATPGSANADFFITLGPMASLDAHPEQPGDNLGFAAFGHVVDGMETVRRILNAPTSPTEGVGAMQGQMIAAPVHIITARRVQ